MNDCFLWVLSVGTTLSKSLIHQFPVWFSSAAGYDVPALSSILSMEDPQWGQKHWSSSDFVFYTCAHLLNFYCSFFLGSQLAPENTLMSFQKAVEQKIYGVQADVVLR